MDGRRVKEKRDWSNEFVLIQNLLMPLVDSIWKFIAVVYFVCFGLTKVKNPLIIKSQVGWLIFNVDDINLFFSFLEKLKKKLFNVQFDWILDKETNYPSFRECKLCIKI